MEKIYMEENSRKRKSLIDFSVVLSFAVAFFAIFSLVAMGFDRVSYAAPVTDENMTFYEGMSSDSRPISVVGKSADGQRFSVPLYYSDSSYTNPVFCIEHKAEVKNGIAYTRKDSIDDYGLLYLLNNSFVNEKNIIKGTTNKYAEAWATQVAIWVYLYETDASNPMNAIDANELSAIKAATGISVVDSDNIGNENDLEYGVSIYDTYIRPLIDKAKSSSSLKRIVITKEDGEMQQTSDGKFYQTPLITVVGEPSSDFINYDINLSGIDGAIAVDENGENLELTNVSSNQKFYVRIPSDKVTETAQTLQIGVTGHFNTLSGHQYHATSGQYQKVVSVTGDTTNVSDALSIEVVGAPDTGMNTAQTIYFIGLVVLLCGVGIVYANAKPVEARQ